MSLAAIASEIFNERIVVLVAHEWLNIVLALSGMVVALSAANRMSKETELTIILAFSTTGAGLLGQVLGTFMPDRFSLAFDTLLYGGVLALLIGTRRRTIWLRPEWMPRLSLVVSAFVWAIFFGAA